VNLNSARRTRIYSSGNIYLKAAVIFFGSRALILAAIFYAAHFVAPSPDAAGIWNATDSWYRYLLRWDVGWYSRIAREGYAYNGDDTIEQPVVFFPLHPLLARFTYKFFGISAPLALLIISNLAIFLTVFPLTKLIKDLYGEKCALAAVALLFFFPTSFFFSAGYTESLALLFIVGFFLALEHESFLAAAICAALALATRSTSLILMLPLWWSLWRKYRNNIKQLIWKSAALTVIAASGLWLYMIYLWRAFGHPLAFATAQRAWHGSDSFAHQLRQTLTLRPFSHLADVWNYGVTPAALNVWFFLAFVIVTLVLIRRLNVPMILYSIMMLALLYFTKSASKVEFQSFNRYLLLVFPTFILAGDCLKTRPRLFFGVLILFSVGLFIFMALYAQWYWVG
jgi:hypothetical protein